VTKKIRPLLAGNWKMNGTRDSLTQIKTLADAIKSGDPEKVEVLLCPPATLLYVSTALCDDSPLAIGAQDCHEKPSGAHTGDISADMIADCFGTYVITGHSERRRDHGETSALVRAKTEAAHAADLTVIVCVGETAEERSNGETIDVLKRQIDESVPDAATAENTVIAYEPVWAIGTGNVPQADDIAEAHAFMRAELVARFGSHGHAMRLLYGGSANPSNAASIIAINNVNGLLVGGASLKAADFIAMYQAYLSLAAD
jgi:triosephosphate isomerase (TIM)